MNTRKVSVFAGAAALVGVLIWLCWPERNLSAALHAVPRMAVGMRTFAIVRLDVAQATGVSGSGWSSLQDSSGAKSGPSAGEIQTILQVLAGQGVTQVVVPVNLELGSGEGLGLYLGGRMRSSPEEMESAVLTSGAGKFIKLISLMTAVSSCGSGWRFWGLGGGVSSRVDAQTADRYENAFKASGRAVAQVIVLGSSPGGAAAPAPKPTDPRIVRQLSRLRIAAEGMDSFRLAIVRDSVNPSALRHESAALFIDDAAASRFAASWRALAGDLSSAAAPVGEPGLLDRSLGPVLEALSSSVPRAEGRLVKWGADDRASATH